MRRLLTLAFALMAFGAQAQTVSCTGPTGANCVPTVPYTSSGAVNSGNPLQVANPSPAPGTAGAGYPPGATAITGNGTGTTGAVVGTLAAASGKFTYICGFTISTAGGTATSGPVTVAGLIGSSMVFQLPANTTAGQIFPTQNFFPCIQGSAVNTAITVTTTAALGATAVDVNAWGFQQ